MSNPVPVMLDLEAVMELAIQEARDGFVACEEELSKLPTRFPVVVLPQTRAFLEYHAKVMGMSISSLAGLILNKVVSETLKAQRAPDSERRTT